MEHLGKFPIYFYFAEVLGLIAFAVDLMEIRLMRGGFCPLGLCISL